jgi:DNA primase
LGVLVGGLIPEETVREILHRCNIVELVGDYVQLKRVGSTYQALCPFHHDSKPSFYVNESRGFFHCFGCGAGGNAFHFLMKLKGISFPEAVEEVARRVGVQVSHRRLPPQDQALWEKRTRLLEVNKRALEFFQEALRDARGKKAREYLQGRGISPSSWELFSLGWAPEGWRNLSEHMRALGDKWLSEAQEAGLLVRGHDRFRGRVMFPILDEDSTVLGFGGRTLGGEDPKYLNSPESAIFSKGRCLYGIQVAKGEMRKREKAVVVEGYMDAMALHEAGIKNTVATLGTALTRDHLLALRRHAPTVVFLFDGDSAGERATLKAVDLCLEAGMWGEVVRLPQGEDPDSFVKKRGPEEMARAIEGAIPLMDYFVQKTVGRFSSKGPEAKRRILGEIVPRLRLIGDPIVRDHYVKLVAAKTGVDDGLVEELTRREPPRPWKRAAGPSPLASESPGVERLLLQCLLQDPSLARGFDDELLEEIQDGTLRELARALRDCVQDGVSPDPARIQAMLQEAKLGQKAAELMARMDEVGEEVDRICEDCLRRLRRKAVERKIHSLVSQIEAARARNDEDRLRELEARRAQLVLEKKRLSIAASKG